MASEKNIEIEQRDLDIVEAESVQIRSSNVRSIEGVNVSMEQGFALSIDGEKVQVTQGLSGLLRGKQLDLNQSASLVALGDETTLKQSVSQWALARREAAISKSVVGIVGAAKVSMDKSASVLVLAREVHGQVNTLFDWRSALAFGAAVGGVLGMLSILRRG